MLLNLIFKKQVTSHNKDKRFYAGLSVPQVFGFSTDYNDFSVQRIQHFYAIAGGIFPVYDNGFFELHGWSRYVINASFQYGLNLKRSFRNILWVGFSGANTGEVSMELGVIPGGLAISYAYNMYLNSYGYNFGPAHELRLSYSFER